MESCVRWKVGILLLIFLNLSFCEKIEPPRNAGGTLKVKSVPPLYINEVREVTLYEATIPIFFHVKLPEIPDLNEFGNPDLLQRYNCSEGDNLEESENVHNQHRKYFCALEKQFILASNHVVKDLQEQRTQLNTEQEIKSGKRKRRQVVPIIAVTSLVAGFLLRPAISKYTGSLFGTNEDWSNHYNQMRESVIQQHEMFINFENSTRKFNHDVTEALGNMSETLTEQRRDLIWSLHLFSTKMHADLVQDAMNSCKTKYLPSNLISPDFLRKSLETLDRNLKENYNYSLAINNDKKEIGRYYKLPIVDCLFSEDMAHITLNIPLKQKDSKWKLHEIIHTKFAFKEQVCEVYPQEASYLAEENLSGRTVLITNHMLRYCSIYEHQLCMIPMFSRDSVQSLKCSTLGTVSSRAINYEDLVRSCSYRCYTNDELIVTQIDPTKIVVTNARKISFQCGTFPTTHLATGRLGVIEINLNCNCKITLNDNQVLPKPFPCNSLHEGDAYLQLKNLVTFTLPVSWSHNFSKLELEIGNHEDMHHHVNHEWPWTIPVLNFSNAERQISENFTVPEEVPLEYGAVLTTVEIWLALLTLAVIFNFALTIYCFFKLVIYRYRAYEFAPVPVPPREYSVGQERAAYFNEMKISPKSNQTLIPTFTSAPSLNLREEEDTISKVEEEDSNVVEVVARRTRKVVEEKDSYENNRWSASNKLI